MPRNSKSTSAIGMSNHATKLPQCLAEGMFAHLRSAHVPRNGVNADVSFRCRYVLIESADLAVEAGDKPRQRFPQLPALECQSSSAGLQFAMKETERESKLLRSYHGANNRRELAANATSS